jgi:hypothetical protein
METLEVTVIEPKARQLLDDLENLKLIEIAEIGKKNKPKRRFGSMKGLVVHIADDFDAPLEDFREYM